jgi:predicted DCC family thiol-disulfide oxidoreductase YuxK
MVIVSLITVVAVASVFFGAGLYDRSAALVISYALACLFGRNLLSANLSLPFVGGFLLWHICLPPAPYGSWSARTRIDPRGGWCVPPWLFAVAWIVMSVGYSYTGYTKLVSSSGMDGAALPWVLNNPVSLALELGYAPLALIGRARPWIWVAMAGVLVASIILTDFAVLSLGMLLVHLLTFDPQWLPPRWRERRDMLFYDGTCGLCHCFTRFVLSEDRDGTAFTFAPLQGETFAGVIAGHDRSTLPDSVIVRTEAGELLTRSDAVLYTLLRLGGLWRILAVALRVVPRRLRNGGYDFVARIRYQLVARARSFCPILPPDLRSRFQS